MELSPEVRKVLDAEKITAEELDYMLSKAALTSIRDCNRRYFHWVFKVEFAPNVKGGYTVFKMEAADMLEIGNGPEKIMVDHDECEGAGCRACGWIGSVQQRVSHNTARGLYHGQEAARN